MYTKIGINSGYSEEFNPAYITFAFKKFRKTFNIPNWIIPSFIDKNGVEYSREFSLVFIEDAIMVYYGVQERYGSSQYKSWNIPWLNFRFNRHSAYNPNHTLFEDFEVNQAKQKRSTWNSDRDASIRDAVPKVLISFKDFDGEEIIATCHIEELEWLYGTSWCSWLSYIRKPLIRRVIEITFNKETGNRKNSWKGGTIGCGEDMIGIESIFSTFSRYANKNKFTDLKEII